MTLEQLQWIKARQREFEQQFGSPLLVDFAKMKGLSNRRIQTTEAIREEAWAKYRELAEAQGLCIEDIASVQHIDARWHPRERKVLNELARWFHQRGLRRRLFKELTGRDRYSYYLA